MTSIVNKNKPISHANSLYQQAANVRKSLHHCGRDIRQKKADKETLKRIGLCHKALTSIQTQMDSQRVKDKLLSKRLALLHLECNRLISLLPPSHKPSDIQDLHPLPKPQPSKGLVPPVAKQPLPSPEEAPQAAPFTAMQWVKEVNKAFDKHYKRELHEKLEAFEKNFEKMMDTYFSVKSDKDAFLKRPIEDSQKLLDSLTRIVEIYKEAASTACYEASEMDASVEWRFDGLKARLAHASYKARKLERLEQKAGAFFASKTKPLPFDKPECVFAAQDASHAKNIHELYALIEKLGIVDLLRVKKEETDKGPILHFAISEEYLGAIIQYKYPELFPYFGKGIAWSIGADAIVKVSTKGLVQVDQGKMAKSKEQLMKKATAHFESSAMPDPVKCTISEDSFSSDKELLEEIYERLDFDGLCIGESHVELASRKFLIDNLQNMYDLGVRTLFLEALKYDIDQEELDEYFRSPQSTPMSPRLEARLLQTDAQYGHAFGYLSIVRQAKLVGIRIVSLDITPAFAIGKECAIDNNSYKRMIAMNYVAEEIIRHEKGPGKYAAFIGYYHGSNSTWPTGKVPGIANLLQCPHIVIQNSASGKNEGDANVPLDSKIDQVHLRLKRFIPVPV